MLRSRDPSVEALGQIYVPFTCTSFTPSFTCAPLRGGTPVTSAHEGRPPLEWKPLYRLTYMVYEMYSLPLHDHSSRRRSSVAPPRSG